MDVFIIFCVCSGTPSIALVYYFEEDVQIVSVFPV